MVLDCTKGVCGGKRVKQDMTVTEVAYEIFCISGSLKVDHDAAMLRNSVYQTLLSMLKGLQFVKNKHCHLHAQLIIHVDVYYS